MTVHPRREIPWFLFHDVYPTLTGLVKTLFYTHEGDEAEMEENLYSHS